ncbi:MAG: phosphatase PAP2 family protein [Variovorax sp.]|nr:MAG: phosphatase PAP2 family protein [Variovorax sp.]
MATEAAPMVAFAQTLGEHALPAFLSVLMAAMAMAGLFGALVHRRRVARNAADDAPPLTVARLLVAFAAGFGLIIAAASLFAAIARRLGPDRTMALADQALADAIAQHTPTLAIRGFAWLTHLGDPPVLALLGLVVVAALWIRRERLLAIGWTLALGGNALLNPLLKGVFERVRPIHDHGLAAQAAGFSFPSGHSSGAMVAYGMLLYLALRVLPPRWHAAAAMGAVALVLGVACSRVFLRVHFASDVAAGLLSGLAWAGVCVAGLELARHRRRRG